MRRLAALLAGLALACALAPWAKASEEPASKPENWLDGLPFVPVPEIDTAPQAGVTVGLIPVVLSNNEQGQIDRILAPDIIHSEYFGWGARWRAFHFPSDDERWSVVAGAKQYVEREFDAVYERGLQRSEAWSWTLHAMYDRSGTGRFYGLGNDSSRADQTNFIDAQARIEATAARNFRPDLQLAWLERADTVDIEPGMLDSLPSTQQRFPGLPGLGRDSELQQRLVLSYDTRDSVVVPRSGERLAAFAGFSSRALASGVSYTYLGADGTLLQPLGRRVSLVEHLGLRYMPTFTDAPFWALSSLGGDRSILAEAQPLRAFGAGRFVDRNVASASFEARTWAGDFHGFDTDLTAEFAPFVDAGKVFSAMEGSPISQAHVGGGLGLRLVARPFVVGYLDIAYGVEKFAVFSGINYPF